MILDLVTSVKTESILRLPLNHLIDKISSFNTPANGHFLLLDMDLLGQNIVSDLLPRLADVGPAPKHALVGEDAHSEVIYCE